MTEQKLKLEWEWQDFHTFKKFYASFNLISQSAHFFSSLAVVFFFHIINPDWDYSVVFWIIVCSAIKEGIIDRITEDELIRGSSLLDFIIQSGAALIGLLIVM